MRRRRLIIALICSAALVCVRDASAQPEGQPCAAEPTDQLIAYGDLLTCAIDFVGDSDLFRFNGAAGEVVLLQMTDHSNILFFQGVSLELRSPSGALLQSSSNFQAATIHFTLADSGTFLIRAAESGNDQTISYTIAIDRLAPPSVTAVSLNPGDAFVAQALDPIGDADIFVFGGVTGDLVRLAATDRGNILFTEGVTLQLFRPDGTMHSSATNFQTAIIETSLDQSGEFVVRVTERNNDHRTTYNLEYQCLVGSCPSFHRLTVARTGAGTVTSHPPGIDCGADCTERYFAGAVVTLMATPVQGWMFDGWSGDPDCLDGDMTMSVARACDATFSFLNLPPVAVNDAFGTTIDTPLVITPPGVLDNDNSNGGGAMTAVLVDDVSNGTLALNVNGSFTYVPALNFVGTDTFTYRASHASGVSNVATVSITVLGLTSPLPPTGLVVDSVVNQLVTIRFSAPPFGPAPTGFVVKGGVLPGEVLATLPTGSVAPIFSFVAPSGSFFIRVHTLAGGTESGPSNEVALHVNVPVPPSAPTHLLGLINGSFLALAWKNTYSGGPPSDVVLDVTGSVTGSFSLGVTDSFNFPVVPSGTYTFTVRAANSGGASAPSNPVTLTFPGVCLGPPLTPTNIVAYVIGSAVFVRWDPPQTGPAPTTYLLNVTGAFIGAFPTTGRMLSGSVGPGSYGLSVRAVNACGQSSFTQEQVVTVP